ncbi:hypothetical protein SAMN05216559_2621 [Halomicrobium zhouii]|uniref:DUF7847 domain-containing protein n=1 Tax=Halomicrobium zhouii TaxID=767519 RepID=A0A1I6LFS1_9EURY|nr:hypothetical protein [Halomicrobium zhouii]SFS02272.1 hypothetical protein SAMN05216559_2621 [Halomicrobium zhouii]
MALHVLAAVEQGLSRTFQRNGLLLVAAFVAFGLLGTLASEATTGTYAAFFTEQSEIMTSTDGTTPSPLEPLFDVTSDGIDWHVTTFPPGTVVGLSVLFAVGEEALRIAAIRVFASAETRTIPATLVRRNLAWATLHAVVAGVLVAIATAIGLVLLIIPGIFLALSFYFVRQVIALEDATTSEAMGRAWDLSAGNRLDLVGLAVVVALVGLVASIPPALVGLVSPLAGAVAGAVTSAFVLVFSIAATTRAFEQVRGAEANRP